MDNLDLPAILSTYREENGLSMRGMARILIMSKSAYERLEKGITKPSYEEIKRILKLLDINPDTFREIDTRGRPVGTISFLKRGLLYGSISTHDALNCLKDLAEAVTCKPVLEWLELETDGCEMDIHNVPLYRFCAEDYDIEYEQDGHLFFMFLPAEFILSFEERSYFIYDAPIDAPDKKWLKTGSILPLYEDRIQYLEQVLQKVYGSDFKLIRAAGRVSPQFKQKVLLTVQEIILQFLLCIETEFGQNASVDVLRAHKHQLGIMFRKILDSAETGDHLDLPMKPETQKEVIIVKGDEERFMDWLDQHDISLFEQDEFYVVLDELEKRPAPEGIVPPEMCAWAKKVTSSNAKFREHDEKLLNGLKVFYGVNQ